MRKLILGTLGTLALACGACDSSGTGGDDTTAGCDVVGSWTVPGATFAFAGDGTTLLTLGGAGTVTGTWTRTGDVLSFTDTAGTGAGVQQQCGAGVVGMYHAAFHPDCAAVTFTLISDACAQRAAAVDGTTATR